MNTVKCPCCHREIDYSENIVMVQCRCGEVVYSKKKVENDGRRY
jgi:hypothetical protein